MSVNKPRKIADPQTVVIRQKPAEKEAPAGCTFCCLAFMVIAGGLIAVGVLRRLVEFAFGP